jgi:hypothetical protein
VRLPVRYLLTTLTLVAVGLAWQLSQAAMNRPRLVRPAPPAVSGRPASVPLPRLMAREVLERATALALTPDEIAGLEALDRRWQRESGELERMARLAGDELARFMDEARARGRTSLEEIERRSGEFSELSRELGLRRRLHGEAAINLLSEAQRRELGAKPGELEERHR